MVSLIEAWKAVKVLEANGYDVKALKKRITNDILFLYGDEYYESKLSFDDFLNLKIAETP